MTKKLGQAYFAKAIKRGVFMKVLRTSIVLIAILLALSSFSNTQAQVEENTIFLPIIMNNYKVRSETVYVREETVQRVSRSVLNGLFVSDQWMGIVHNDSSQTIKYVRIEVLYYNSTNQLIGRQTASITGVIPPDGERCFVSNVDSQVSQRFTRTSFRITSYSEEDPQKYRSPIVEYYSKNVVNYFFSVNDKIFQYQGTIHNNSPETIYNAVVTVTGFDNLGRVAECVNQPFSFDGTYPDQYYFFTLDGSSIPETIFQTIIEVSGSVGF